MVNGMLIDDEEFNNDKIIEYIKEKRGDGWISRNVFGFFKKNLI